MCTLPKKVGKRVGKPGVLKICIKSYYRACMHIVCFNSMCGGNRKS